MTIRIRATLEDGRTLVGPVQGNGGKLGDGVLYASPERAAREAIASLMKARRWAALGQPLAIYEPEPGHVAIYPDYSARGDGPPVVIPLKGTRFECYVRVVRAALPLGI